MNSTEVQNPQRKLMCLCLSMCLVLFFPLQSLLMCFRSSLLLALRTLSLLIVPQTVRLFYVSLHSQAPQQQYTVHCMHYSPTL